MPHRPQPSVGPVSSAAFDVVAVAASLGGLKAIEQILSALPGGFPAPILVVQHRDPRSDSLLPDLLSRRAPLPVKGAEQGERLRGGTVYVARPDRHLLVCPDRTLALSDGPKVEFTRPSANPLFASVAACFRERAIALVLTGKLKDGAAGVRVVKAAGGAVLAQDEATSRAFGMPGAAIATGCVDHVLPLDRIAPALVTLVMARCRAVREGDRPGRELQ